jgi:hypothetical protein
MIVTLGMGRVVEIDDSITVGSVSVSIVVVVMLVDFG